jgi:ABC-2 type transport system permease protein
VMIEVIGGASTREFRAFVVVGTALWAFVISGIAGLAWSILDDRERYRMLKYLYIAPINMPVYLFGRAVARFIIGTLAVVITIAAGVLFFDLPVDLAAVNWPMFFAALMLGVVALTFMGIVIGMWTMTLRTEPWFLGEGVAAALYLFSGAIFPITLLPEFLQPIGFVLPMTYWLELLRRALLGPGAAAFPTLAGFSNVQLFAILFGITLLFGLITAFAYRYFDLAARDAGMIDSQNNF